MEIILQFIASFASIFSVPLAIIIYLKTCENRQNKIRLEIVRSLSYRIGDGKVLSKSEINSVLKSKLRDYNIRKSNITEVAVLEDITADVVSNPFLSREQKSEIIKGIDTTINYSDQPKVIAQSITSTSVNGRYGKFGSTAMLKKKPRNRATNNTKKLHSPFSAALILGFPIISILYTLIFVILTPILKHEFELMAIFQNNTQLDFFFAIAASIIVTIISEITIYIINIIKNK